MTDRLTDEELEEWRAIIAAFPQQEREKWQTLMKSGRLLSIVVFLDGASTSLEKFGAFGIWLNKVLKGIFYMVAVVLLFKVVVSGEIALGEIWKLFIK
jgi:hypothetical protein